MRQLQPQVRWGQPNPFQAHCVKGEVKEPAMDEETRHVHYVDVTAQGIHRIAFVQFIGHDDLVATLRKLDEQIDSEHANGGPVLILVDVTNLEKVSMDARKYGVQWLKQKRFSKLAAVCKSLYIKHFVQMLVVACGLNNEMRVYGDIEQANDWLIS